MSVDLGLTAVEHRLLTSLLDGDHPLLQHLRTHQLPVVTAAQRSWSEVGCTAQLRVPDDAPAAARMTIDLADVGFQLADCVNPGHAILFVAEGRLDAIEYYNWTDAWPAEPLLRRVFYYRRGPDGEDHESNNRDVEAIAAKLAA